MSNIRQENGFTIVELLIVIVVIAILATISVVAYNGIQNRANDSAIQSDLRNVGQKFLAYQATEGALPAVSGEYTTMGLKSTRTAYGNGYSSNSYNFAYCRDTVTTGAFAIVAASKSGNVYVYKDGAVKPGVGPLVTMGTTCSNNGIANAEITSVNWFFGGGAWKSWMGE
jgi:general secretion pathway protein G